MKNIISKLNTAESMIILTHINEDPDALGSSFALAQAMRSIGKKANVCVSGKIEKRLDFMGSDYEIYNPNKTYDYDLCVCVDCGDIDRLGERKKVFDSIGNTISIDHHYSNTYYAGENYVEGDASSAGQIIYKLLKEMKLTITKEIAVQLYTAICSDTGCFKYSNVSSETMYAAGELIGYDINHAEIARLLFESEPLWAVELKAEVSSNITSCYDGKLRIVTAEKSLYEKYNIPEEDIPNLVDIPRMIENTEVAVCLKEQADGVRVNLRSNGDFNVSELAAKFGGGGHKKAAGCTLKDMSLNKIKEIIIKECSYLSESLI